MPGFAASKPSLSRVSAERFPGSQGGFAPLSLGLAMRLCEARHDMLSWVKPIARELCNPLQGFNM